MPKSGKSSERGGPSKAGNTVETDPLVHTKGPDPELESPPAAPKALLRSDSELPRTMDLGPTPSMPPPDFASEIKRNMGQVPAGVRGRPASEVNDAWSGFDDVSGGEWGVSSGSVVDEVPREDPLAGVLLTPHADSGPSAGPDDLLGAVASVPPAKLVAVSGAEAGREFVVRHTEMGVGRGAENDVVLADASVSRDHARLVFDGSQFTLQDLNSGNGTFVNGQRISKQLLQHGDEIAFGNAAFRFIEGHGRALPDDVAAAVRPPRRLQARGWRYAASMMGIMAVGVVLVGTLYMRRYGGMTGSETRRDLMFIHFARGVEAFKGRHWDQADNELMLALGLDPQNPRTKRYIKAVARERVAESQLAEAKQARKRGDLTRANTLALGILDSTFRPDAQSLLHDIDTECEARIVRGQQQLAAGQPVQAMQLLQSVDAVRPGRPDVAEILVRANLKGGGSRVPPASLANRAARRRVPTYTGPLADAHRQFTNGDVQPALQTLDALNSEEAAALRDKIEKFWEAYQNGLSEHKLKKAASSIRWLGEAKGLEQQISNGGCKLLGEIDHKLADMYYVQGTQNLSSNELPQAYQSFHNAVALTPDNAAAARKLAELSNKAQAMFDGVGREADVQRARATLLVVTQMVAQDSELYRKAKQRLDALP